MSFYLSNNASQWAKNITGKTCILKDNFDIYYLCLMIGISFGTTKEPEEREITRDFSKTYKPLSSLLIGILISTDSSTTALETKHDVIDHLQNMIDTDSNSNLSPEGETLMNRYVQGGFELLSEHIPEPRNEVVFLLEYKKVLERGFEEEKIWN